MTALDDVVGRDRERAELDELLLRHRLVTVVGPGGIGKTRLVDAVTSTVADRFGGGVLVATLAGSDEGDDITAIVARQLRVETLDALLLRAAAEPMLVVLDNCESALARAGSIAEYLLGGPETLRVVATSRNPLGVAGEVLLPLGPLAVTAVDDEPPPAVGLFLTRAAAVGARWPTDEPTLAAIHELVDRLDGLPLAIEIAAARSRLLAPPDLLDLLGEQLHLLRRPGVDDSRHHSLDTVIAESYDRLPGELQWALRQLSVIAAPFDLQLASDVLDPEGDGMATLDTIGELVDASLLAIVPRPPGEVGPTTYRLLDSIRSFARDALAAHNEVGGANDRYVDAMVTFAGRIGREAQKAFTPGIFDRIRESFAHLAAAIAWCVDNDPTAERAYRLFLPLYGPNDARPEVADLAVRAEARWSGAARFQAEAWAVMATMFFLTGDYPRGRALGQQAVDHPAGSPFAKVIGHRTLGFISAMQGDPDEARHQLEQAIGHATFSDAFARELRISWAAVTVDPAESAAALDVLADVGADAALNGEGVTAVWAAVTTAYHRVLLDDLAGALRAVTAAVNGADATGLSWSVSTAHRVMGSVVAAVEGWEPAAPHFRLAVDTALTTGDLEGVAMALRAAAGAAHHLGDDELAAALWATIPPLPGRPVLRSIFHDDEEQLAAELGPPTAVGAEALVIGARALLGPSLHDPSSPGSAVPEGSPPGFSTNDPSSAAPSSADEGRVEATVADGGEPDTATSAGSTGAPGEAVVRFGAYELDTAMHELRHDGERIHMEPQVFDVLAYLVARRPSLVTREELLDNVWGDRFVSAAAVSSRIASARRATGDDGKRQSVIRTVHGKGFVFVAETT